MTLSINRFYTTSFSNKRMVYASNKSSLVLVGIFSGHIQQASAELAEQMNMVFTKTFSIWCDETTDIQEGDDVLEGSNTYSVKAVQLNNIGDNAHLEIIAEKNVDG